MRSGTVPLAIHAPMSMPTNIRTKIAGNILLAKSRMSFCMSSHFTPQIIARNMAIRPATIRFTTVGDLTTRAPKNIVAAEAIIMISALAPVILFFFSILNLHSADF